VLALDPRNAVAVWWLTAIAAKEHRRRDLDSLTTRLLGLDPSPFIVTSAKGQRAIVMGDTAGETAYVAELRRRDDGWAQTSAGVVTYTTQDLAAGRRLWGVITEPSRSPEIRLLARTVLAKIELTGGRRAAARAELDSARVLDAGTALEYRAGYGLTRFMSLPPAELAGLRDSLQRWTPPAAPGVDSAVRLYLLGLLSARLGDEAAAARFAAELERSPRSTPVGRFAADDAKAVRSEMAWLSGRRDEALRILESAGFWRNDSGLEEKGDSPFTTHLHERFARAELLYELGREEEALRWFDPLSGDFLYPALAELREGQIYQHRQDRLQAKAHYSRFVELWSDCDPDLRPRVREAQEALAALR
jgi:tetratricopeptide (TPR) repeat protein